MLEAHGLGGGSDLPIPASLTIAGATAALTLSFVVLLLAWRRPRYGQGRGGRPVPASVVRVLDGPVLALVLRAAGLVLLGFTVWAATRGPDVAVNPTFGIVYVWLWVGIVPTSLLLGRFFRAVSPARTLHLLLARALRLPPDQGLREYPAWLGYWPAAVGLFAFVWLELVYPSATYLGPVRLWFALYFAAMLIGSAVFGDRWLARADPFEVYSSLVAHLSVWARDATGRLVVTSPLRNLAGIVPEPGLVAVVAVLLGSTAWDSFRESATWVRFGQTTTLDVEALNTAMLLAAVLLVGLTFAATTMVGGGSGRRIELPSRLAHSVVPIVVGYMVAHYLTFFVEIGQLTLTQVSDPMLEGADLFGTAGLAINYWWSEHPSVLATTKVLAIVLGHVVGVVAAHDRALDLLPRRHQVTGQLPLLAAMVLYTFGGLYLLFGV